MPIAAPTHSRPGLSFWLVLLAPLVAILVYVNGLDNALLAMDATWTAGNSQVTQPRTWGEILLSPTPMIGEAVATYRPILALVLRAEWKLWGSSPSSFHSFSLLLFLANVIVMLVLTGRLLNRHLARAAAVLLFALHPMASQALHGIAGQGILLATLMSLTAALIILLHESGTMPARPTLALLAACGLLACGSHELGLLLTPLMAGLCLVVGAATLQLPAARTKIHAQSGRGRKKEEEPPPAKPLGFLLLIPLGGAALLYLIARWTVLRHLMFDPTLRETVGREFDAPAWLIAPSIMTAYLRRLLWPTEPTLIYSNYYEPGTIPPIAIGWLTLLLLIGFLAFLFYRKQLAAWALLWVLLPLVAISHWLPLARFMSEEPLLYALPGLGCLIGIACDRLLGCQRLPVTETWRQRLVTLLLILACLPMARAIWKRGSEWKTADTLWQAELARHATHPRPLIELSDERGRAEKWQEGLDFAARARPLAKGPDLDGLIRREAAFYVNLKQFDKFGDLLDDELIAERTVEPNHFAELAGLALNQKMNQRAEGLLRREIENNPEGWLAYGRLADLAMENGNLREAIDLAQKSIAKASNEQRAAALTRYGIVLYRAGQMNAAQDTFAQALRLDGSLYVPQVYLIRIQIALKQWDAALTLLNRAFAMARTNSFGELGSLYEIIWTQRIGAKAAREGLMALVERYPADVDLRLLASYAQLDAREFNRAEKLLAPLITLRDKRRADAMVAMAYIAIERDSNQQAARELLNRALELNPDQQRAKQMLGDLSRPKTARATSTPAAPTTGLGVGTGAPANPSAQALAPTTQTLGTPANSGLSVAPTASPTPLFGLPAESEPLQNGLNPGNP